MAVLKNRMEWESLHSYSRRQAFDDGVLFDVSAVASEYGFKIHTAVTAGL